MKIFLSCISQITLIILFPVTAGAQVSAQTSGPFSAFSHVVDAKPYAGKKFRVEAAIRLQSADSSEEAELWARVDLKDKKMGFFNNMMDKPIRSTEWKVYSQQGKIDKNADYLVFGGLYRLKGIYYFDDFRLFIENADKGWDTIVLEGGNFETDTATIRKHWAYAGQLKGLVVGKSDVQPYEGIYSLRIDGTKATYPKSYGQNDNAGKYALVNGIKIYYEEYGSGEPLLLLHGNSENINSFRLQIPELSKQFHLYVVDTRGHGKSGEDGKTYTYDLFAEDMNVLLDQLHLDSVNILGWSDGGNTGLIMAMKYPRKVKRLLTMGAVIFIDNTVVGKKIFKVLDKEKRELASDTSAWAAARLRRIELLLTEPKHSFAELASIKCPVLVMAGEKDIVKEGHTKGIAAAIPGATLMIIPKASHEFPWEDAKAFNKLAIDFFSGKQP